MPRTNTSACLCVFFLSVTVSADKYAERILHHLFHKYDGHVKDYVNTVRPTGEHGSGKLTVKLGIRLSQLLDVDEKNQIMTTSLWLKQEWHDFRLAWHPLEYGNVTLIHIPIDHIWRPDIVLYNNADGDFEITLKTKAKIEYTGRVVWEPPGTYKSYCPIDVEYFPFDIQTCFMKFGSWTYDDLHIELKHFCMEKEINNTLSHVVIKTGMDMTLYYPNMEWEVINTTAKWKRKIYNCCGYSYSDLTFNVTLRRKTLFYALILIAPCVSLSILTVLVFYLPGNNKKKIELTISILLALTVYFLLLSEINPPTSLVIPLIGKYLLFIMVTVTMSIGLTVCILNVHYRNPRTHKMTDWTRWLFIDVLPKILMIQRPAKVSRKRFHETELQVRTLEEFSNRTYASIAKIERLDKSHNDIYKEIGSHPVIRRAIQDAKYLASRIREKDLFEEAVMDWRYMARVIDRFFLLIFGTACVICSLSILLSAPSLYITDPPLHRDSFDNVPEEEQCIF